MFWLDTRESELITMMQPDAVKALPVGDIWIGIDTNHSNSLVPGGLVTGGLVTGGLVPGGLVIERKSIRDLEASILDGRYREQRGRILAFCQENKAQPMYILEGHLSSSTGRLQKKALLKFIHRLIFHYQIPVMQTQNVGETSELIGTLVEQWKEDPSTLMRTTELVKVTDGIHVQKKSNAADPTQFAITCLAQCPGVSVKMAEALITHFGSLKALMGAERKDVESVKVGIRKVGPVVSARLLELLSYERK